MAPVLTGAFLAWAAARASGAVIWAAYGEDARALWPAFWAGMAIRFAVFLLAVAALAACPAWPPAAILLAYVFGLSFFLIGMEYRTIVRPL
ncbi:MAG: hypothetical protein ACYCPQ_02950 [Elusimicrobiota bacterium]